MYVIGVVACTVGIAHTYMGQEAIETECKKRGYEYLIETQGGMGIDNEITEEDVERADVLILATSIGIEMPERFDDLIERGMVIQLDPSEAIKHTADLLDRVEALVKKGE